MISRVNVLKIGLNYCARYPMFWGGQNLHQKNNSQKLGAGHISWMQFFKNRPLIAYLNGCVKKLLDSNNFIILILSFLCF